MHRVELSIEEAVLRALENNRALHVERLNPQIQRTFEAQARAAFDPVLSAGAAVSREEAIGGTNGNNNLTVTEGSVGLSQALPTGTELGLELATDQARGAASSEDYATRAGLTVQQSLLQGFGTGASLATLRQARLDTQFSEYELRGFAEALVAQIEAIYWDYVRGLRLAAIYEKSLNLAEQQAQETRERIRVGDLAETELAAAQAEVARRQEALINLRSEVSTQQIRLWRLVQPGALSSTQREWVPVSRPATPDIRLSPVEEHVAVALQKRPDMNQARLLIERGDVELIRTRNGLLPRMDLFLRLGKTGYADSFGDSVQNLDGDAYDLSGGVNFEFPIINRDARARHRRAALVKAQAEESLLNIEDLIREDVETAYIEVERTRQQIDATATTRRFEEEKVRAEMAKFRVGKSTALLVAQAQRDLVLSEVAEVQAVIGCLKALANLYRLDGTLLERRGIASPG
ncbi:MAG: hypothetical protein A2X46_17955 [Lentisphaerae bacterium GWF2_57_35]|nr:MAG: hypothetical protein A2X46_17955 [Lentisphaerae bacterium GWF2_57_35]